MARVIVPLSQRFLDPREHEGIELIDVREAIAHELGLIDAPGLHLTGELVERGPTAQSKANDLREEV
jgi:hypothetical protein